MKRSEMIKLLAKAYHDCDYYNNFPKENAEILLKAIEQAGMRPPYHIEMGDKTHEVRKDKDNYCCSFHYHYPSGQSISEWEAENE